MHKTIIPKVLLAGLLSFGILFANARPWTPSSAIAASASQTVNASTTASNIISQAERLIGKVSYHFGVNNPSKLWFDCSSFTKYLYKQQGIHLRWGARLQYEDGQKITKDQLLPGDLVFFSTPATDGNTGTAQKIEHVGIYIGDGQFIHNLDPKYNVLISTLNSGWWKKHYIAAARVIPDNGDTAASGQSPDQTDQTVIQPVSAPSTVPITINFQIGKTTASVNNSPKTLDMAPVIVNGTTLVPIRFVSESMGALVNWDGEQRAVIIDRNGTIIELWIGKTTAQVNGHDYPMGIPAQILNSCTMVPVRFISEHMGLSVNWDGSTQTVSIKGMKIRFGSIADN